MLSTLADTTATEVRRLWHSLDDVPVDWGPCVVTIGVFDGVHRGHARLIARTVDVARGLRLPALLLTFDPHPARVAGPRATPRRCPRRGGVPNSLSNSEWTPCSSSPSPARWPPPPPTGSLPGCWSNRSVRAPSSSGTTSDSAQEGQATSTHCATWATNSASPPRRGAAPHREIRYSSTRVRTCLAAGDVTAAAEALGRPHPVAGRLAGRVLQVPTGTALPADGHYRGVLAIHGARPHPVEVVVDHQQMRIRSGIAPAAGMPPARAHFLRSIPSC